MSRRRRVGSGVFPLTVPERSAYRYCVELGRPDPPASGHDADYDRDAPLSALPEGTTLERYEIVRVLGEGAFGITYLARDATLGREVAIKEYLPASLAIRSHGPAVAPRSTKCAPDFLWGRDRFLAEARTLAQLDGVPAVVRVVEYLEANGTAYMVMGLARGETLRIQIIRGALGAERIERILWPLLHGLQQVHATGFLHRDIKPSNIIVDSNGAPTLIDFGASRIAMADRTAAMTAVFTPGYAALEQFVSSKQGPWTDIYGLSATLYHAITGTRPPHAVERTLEDKYRPLVELAPEGFNRSLLAGIDAGMTVRASDRPQSIGDWRKIFSGDSGTPERTVVLQPLREPEARVPAAQSLGARHKLWLAVSLALLLLGGGAYVGRSLLFGTAIRTLTTDELALALEERRKADAAAAEKKSLEEEAGRQAEADAEAKRQADEALAIAKRQREQAERDLAQLKANIQARRRAEVEQRTQAADAAKRALDEASRKNDAEAAMAVLRKADEDARAKAAQQAAEEEAQRKAEAEAAARGLAEETARKKADEEAETKRRADDALAKAQADRQAAERQLAEAEAKAQSDAKKAAAAAAALKAAEVAESALNLTTADRQRIQVALTAVGFPPNGTDGVFGPRSRAMIAAWQTARGELSTGFINDSQRQRLLKEATAAVSKFDEAQKKLEDDKKRAAAETTQAEIAQGKSVEIRPPPTPAPAAKSEPPPQQQAAVPQAPPLDQPPRGMLPCNRSSDSGGEGETRNRHYLGDKPGSVTIDYNLYVKPDEIKVIYRGQVIASSGGARSGRGSFGFDWRPVAGDYSVQVVVTGETWGTRWTYTLTCPR